MQPLDEKDKPLSRWFFMPDSPTPRPETLLTELIRPPNINNAAWKKAQLKIADDDDDDDDGDGELQLLFPDGGKKSRLTVKHRIFVEAGADRGWYRPRLPNFTQTYSEVVEDVLCKVVTDWAIDTLPPSRSRGNGGRHVVLTEHELEKLVTEAFTDSGVVGQLEGGEPTKELDEAAKNWPSTAVAPGSRLLPTDTEAFSRDRDRLVLLTGVGTLCRRVLLLPKALPPELVCSPDEAVANEDKMLNHLRGVRYDARVGRHSVSYPVDSVEGAVAQQLVWKKRAYRLERDERDERDEGAERAAAGPRHLHCALPPEPLTASVPNGDGAPVGVRAVAYNDRADSDVREMLAYKSEEAFAWESAESAPTEEQRLLRKHFQDAARERVAQAKQAALNPVGVDVSDVHAVLQSLQNGVNALFAAEAKPLPCNVSKYKAARDRSLRLMSALVAREAVVKESCVCR